MLATVIHSDVETTVSRVLPQLCIKVGTHIRILDLRNIVCVRAAGNYVDIVMAGGRTVHTKETISHIADRLPGTLFVRVHRSVIVNREHIQEIQSHQNNYEFTLANGTRLLSSATYRKSVRSQFLIGLKNNGRSAESLHSVATAPPLAAYAGQPQRVVAVKTRIRVGEPRDEHVLALLGKITFVETYTGIFFNEDVPAYCASQDDPAIYHAWLEDKAVCAWIVETETSGIPIGYMVITQPAMPFAGARRGADLEIQRIYLLRPFQGMGLGKRLMTQAVQHARQGGYHRLLLGDYRENKSAAAFYQHVGFHPVGEYLCRIGNHNYDDIVFSLDV